MTAANSPGRRPATASESEVLRTLGIARVSWGDAHQHGTARAKRTGHDHPALTCQTRAEVIMERNADLAGLADRIAATDLSDCPAEVRLTLEMVARSLRSRAPTATAAEAKGATVH